ENTSAFPGARDARMFERQPGVLTFTSAPLEKPVEWTGKIEADLKVASSAPDTDFIVRVSDVYPDGRSILLVDYIRRARYREGFTKEVFLKPGEITTIRFDVGWISQIFNKGHRIRVTVCSTAAPFYEPNPNSSAPISPDFPKDAQVAENSVFHQAGAASRIIAPLRESQP
ncbi:MAG: CocE/NonD family hydrolase, partial [Planctomycetes bacterium]|nr:CocE/NonD family hydrolase [Planctomycetota bacterium]